ncbi:XRE family transcriptional regulator [Opitutus terrae]|nr:helix-turn-helix domain-containing protein [Opitutus terrae]
MNAEQRESLLKGFDARLRECIAACGSIYALAKRCEVSIPTLKRYLSGSEPSLTMLVRIAAAANVTPGWLATGQGPQLALPDAGPLPFDAAAKEIRARFIDIQEKLGSSVPKLAPKMLVSPERLRAILTGEVDATAGELVRFCSETNVSLRWILTGQGVRYLFGRPELRDTPTTRHRDPEQFALLLDELSRITDPLTNLNFRVHRVVGDAMAPRFNDGDLAIADTTASLERERVGTYLIVDRGSEFVAYAAKDTSKVVLTFENSKISPLVREWDDQPVNFTIMGRVVYRVAMQRL